MNSFHLLVNNHEIDNKDDFSVLFVIEKDFKFKIKLNPYMLDFSMYFLIKYRKCYYDWRLNKCHIPVNYERDYQLKIHFTSVKFIICCLEDFIFLLEEQKSYANRTLKVYDAYKAIKYNSQNNKTIKISSFVC